LTGTGYGFSTPNLERLTAQAKFKCRKLPQLPARQEAGLNVFPRSLPDKNPSWHSVFPGFGKIPLFAA
jgi:hypothetical protein